MGWTYGEENFLIMLFVECVTWLSYIILFHIVKFLYILYFVYFASVRTESSYEAE